MKASLMVPFACVVLTALTYPVSGHAGERIIIKEEGNSLSLPSANPNSSDLGNALAPGKRKSSSVDAVVAPWQNPLNGDTKRRKALLEALDKKNNWAFQSEEDLLGLSNLNGEDLDPEELLSSDLDNSSSRSLAERVYYGKRQRTESKLDRRKEAYNALTKKNLEEKKPSRELTGADLLAADAMANPDYYQRNFEDQFQSEDLLGDNRGIDRLTRLSERDVTAATIVGMGNLIPQQYTQGNAAAGRMAEFNRMLGEGSAGGMAGLMNPSAGESLLGANPIGQSIIISQPQTLGAAPSLPGGGLGASSLAGASPLGGISSSLESLNATRSIGNTLSGSAMAPSGLGGGAFNLSSPTAAPARQQAPIFFEIPKRTF